MLAARLCPRSCSLLIPVAPVQTVEQRLANNTFGPTANDPNDPEQYNGEVFFCLSCKQDDDFVRGIAGAELEELDCTNKFQCLADILKGEEFSGHAQFYDTESELLIASFRRSHPYPDVMCVSEGEQVDHAPSRYFWYLALSRHLLQVKGQRFGNKRRRVQLPLCVREEIWCMYGDGKTGTKQAPATQE